LSGPGGGIVGAIGDLGESQETLSGPGVGACRASRRRSARDCPHFCRSRRTIVPSVRYPLKRPNHEELPQANGASGRGKLLVSRRFGFNEAFEIVNIRIGHRPIFESPRKALPCRPLKLAFRPTGKKGRMPKSPIAPLADGMTIGSGIISLAWHPNGLRLPFPCPMGRRHRRSAGGTPAAPSLFNGFARLEQERVEVQSQPRLDDRLGVRTEID
jgi:hypothetical protein